ncbi:hypothetical protein [Streptomyces sp. NBC_00045]|uniref:hypothetical protein n=1 Tax=Streptomyces sp. NBC_00045 TaxID=2975625 RepID=UPI002F90C3A2
MATPAEAAPVTVTFNAGANQPFDVPSGVTQLTITATGAAGENAPDGGAGGTGDTVTGTVTVPSGTTTLYVNVATGGGAGGGPGTAGGGSSDVRTCSSAGPGCTLTGVAATDPRLIVAGGGGGGGNGISGFPPTIGATGGNAGTTGQTGGSGGAGGGGGGTQTTAGSGGATCTLSPGSPGTPGAEGVGGTGGASFAAGGGGAGWFGGGGGGGCGTLQIGGVQGPGGGGGGSDHVPTGGTSAPATGAAVVTITYEAGSTGGGGVSILPINLSGILPMFNNISINNNIKSPGATNNTTQDFNLNAP